MKLRRSTTRGGSEIDPDAPNIQRFEVVQALVDRFTSPRYLEIGVNKGLTFHNVEADLKVAVDPEFRFEWEAEQAQRGPSTTYHPVTSDEYFGDIVENDVFEVIYLDGLHTFEQTLRDLINALDHLAPKGVILVDDVRPRSYHASLPDMGDSIQVRKFVGDTSPQWMGDVYRLVWFVDTFFQNLSYATVDNNHGQAVLWRAPRRRITERSVRDVAELSFQDLVLEVEVLRAMPLVQILGLLGDDVGDQE